MQENFDREVALAEIIERELAMFLATNNEGGVSECQTGPDTFRAMRKMAHSAHEDAVLDSYLADLRQAEVNSRNLMVEKYARMDDRLPPLSKSPLLDEIADAEEAFLHEAQARYPHVIKATGRGCFGVTCAANLKRFRTNAGTLRRAGAPRATAGPQPCGGTARFFDAPVGQGRH